jgi:hypothetical protein
MALLLLHDSSVNYPGYGGATCAEGARQGDARRRSLLRCPLLLASLSPPPLLVAKFVHVTAGRYDKNVSPPASVGCHLQCSS